jgi:hypothetical protein
MMTSRSLICLLENQNGGKLQKYISSFEIYHPKNPVITKTVIMIVKYGLHFFFVEMTESDG